MIIVLMRMILLNQQKNLQKNLQLKRKIFLMVLLMKSIHILHLRMKSSLKKDSEERVMVSML